jgi:hypothetical protein
MKYILLLTVVLIGAGTCDLAAQRTSEKQEGEPVTVGTSFELYSEHLSETRTVRIHVPASHSTSSGRYPVVYVLDGEAYYLHSVSTVQALSGLGLMPEVIVVAVHNTNRRLNFTPPTISLPDVPEGGVDAFLDFMEDELIPFVDGRYRTQPLRILIGHSHAGLLSNYALYARPDLFRWHLAIDSPVQLGNFEVERRILEFLSEHPDHIGRLITVRQRFGWSNEGGRQLEELASSSFYTERFDLPGETHESVYFIAMYEGLKRLFHDFQYRHEDVKTLDELESMFQRLSEHYGYEVAIPQQAIRYNAEENLFVGRPDRAEPLIEKMVELYGESSQTRRFWAWAEAGKADPLEETPEAFLNSPAPSAGQMAPFLGTWEGMMPGQTPIEVSFGIEGGTIKAETVQFFSDGERGELEHAGVRMLADGTLEWGYFNGMHPRSIVFVYSATLVDEDTMQVITSVRASMPPGMPDGGMGREMILKRKN